MSDCCHPTTDTTGHCPDCGQPLTVQAAVQVVLRQPEHFFWIRVYDDKTDQLVYETRLNLEEAGPWSVPLGAFESHGRVEVFLDMEWDLEPEPPTTPAS